MSLPTSTATMTMISAKEALHRVLGVARPLSLVTVPIHGALGLILAEDIRAPDPFPPYRSSIKVSTCLLFLSLISVFFY